MTSKETKLQDYKWKINSLFERTILSYDFQNKTDTEIISEAIERGSNQNEFGLFQLGKTTQEEVPVRGKLYSKTAVLMTSINSSGKERISEVKLSSFIYPSYLLTHSDESQEIIFSTIHSKRIRDYSDLFSVLRMGEGYKILVTTSWSAFNEFATESVCVNLVYLNNENNAEVIRKEFRKARIEFLNELLKKPWRYFNSGMIDHDIAREAIKEFEPQIKSLLKNLEVN